MTYFRILVTIASLFVQVGVVQFFGLVNHNNVFDCHRGVNYMGDSGSYNTLQTSGVFQILRLV